MECQVRMPLVFDELRVAEFSPDSGYQPFSFNFKTSKLRSHQSLLADIRTALAGDLMVMYESTWSPGALTMDTTIFSFWHLVTKTDVATAREPC
jgi:hypothetical protein